MSGATYSVDSEDTAALLLRCAAGDRAAFRLLYDRWGSRLHGIALRITRQSALAADATHDAFVQIWQQASRFDLDRGSPEAWMIGLVRYRALDIVRHRAREVPGYEPEERVDETPDALARLVSTTEGAALQRCLNELEVDRRRQDRDLLAAEYVLGSLEGGERGEAERLLATDPGFARSVAAWQQRLTPLAAIAAPVAPPDDVWRRVEASTVPPDKDLELWALPAGETRPRSLGVLPPSGLQLMASLAANTQLLVSLEPKGGSPTGQPTGPVLYGGWLISIELPRG